MPTGRAKDDGEQGAAAEAPAAYCFKLAKLRAAIAAGIAAIERGDYTDVDDEDLDAFLDSLTEQAPR